MFTFAASSPLVVFALALTMASGGIAMNSSAPALNATKGWSVQNCIKIQMDAKIEIRVDKTKNETLVMEVPESANATGDCNFEDKNSTNVQFINITWSEADPSFNDRKLNRNLELYFLKNMSMSPPMYGVARINAKYDILHYIKTENKTVDNRTVFTNHTYLEYAIMTSYSLSPMEFLTPLNRSYSCDDIGDLALTTILYDTRLPGRPEKIENSNMTAVAVHMDAYRPDSVDPHTLQAAMDCSFRPSDIVPIIVGCTLAGTVIMVLVAYLIGRRRSRARGYQSV